MKTIQYILIICLILLTGTGCENNGFFYQDEPRIRLEGPKEWTLETDSLEYSFVSSPTHITEKQMDVTLYVMGMTTNYDRTAKLEVVPHHTTAPEYLYTCPSDVVIPAGSNHAVCPIILKRSTLLQEATVRLYIQIAASEDFAVGCREQTYLLLKWNDQISQPSNWEDELKEFFGTYSNNKYRFMLNNTGVAEFSTKTMTWAELQSYKIQLTNLLDLKTQENPDDPGLKDENTGLAFGFDF